MNKGKKLSKTRAEWGKQKGQVRNTDTAEVITLFII